MPILFCNTAWMERYAGRRRKDPPLGGGGFVNEEGWAGEECNFVKCGDGHCYGHVETIKGKIDRQINITNLGASGNATHVDGVDVVWTAPLRGKGPRVVVGWWLNARVYRQRQQFNNGFPSQQHRRDRIESYIIRAKASNVTLLDPSARDLILQRGSGWSGQTSWWYADKTESADAKAFVAAVKERMRQPSRTSLLPQGGGGPVQNGRASGSAASQRYWKYLATYETVVHPRHHALQERFKQYLRKCHPKLAFPKCHRDDLRYVPEGQSAVMVEVKPTDAGTVRFAIRTAIGQLLDYRQQQKWTGRQLILVETTVVGENEKRLAFDNGFGIAYPMEKAGFQIEWPPGIRSISRR